MNFKYYLKMTSINSTDIEKLKIIDSEKRVNGFSGPPNAHQAAVFLLVVSNIVTFVIIESQ